MTDETKNAPDAADTCSSPAAGSTPGKGDAPRERLPDPVPGEVGGPKGPEPTRYGDWEQKGRVTDF